MIFLAATRTCRSSCLGNMLPSIGIEKPLPASRCPVWLAERQAEHFIPRTNRDLVVIRRPAVLVVFSHDGAAQFGQVCGYTGSERLRFPVIPGVALQHRAMSGHLQCARPELADLLFEFREPGRQLVSRSRTTTFREAEVQFSDDLQQGRNAPISEFMLLRVAVL